MPRNRIRELREESRLSQAQVASAVGVHMSTVSRWESGTASIPDSRKQQLAEFLGVSVPFMMGWNGEGAS